MARNQTLLKILNDVRGEARLSLNPAHNISDREAQISLIQREQERLWADYDWPHLTVDRYIPTQAGKRFYNPSAAYNEAGELRGDLSFDRIESVSVQDDRLWRKVSNGISANDRLAYDSQAGEQSWPPRRWTRSEEDLIEIWPVPDESAVFTSVTPDMQGVIRLRGVRNLRRLVDDDDRADLDDRLLVLFCAAAILAEAGAKDANLKLETATRHYTRLKGEQDKRETFSLFGTRRHCPPHRPYVSRYRPPE